MEQRGVIRSAGLIGALTGASRVLGLVRDMLMAGVFGTSAAMSAFVVAFKVPNLFRALFGEGALSAAFIPVFVETRAGEGDEAAWRLSREVLTLLVLILSLLVAAGILGITLALRLPGLAPRVELTLRLARVMLPYLGLICLAAIAMGILNAHHRFAVPAAAPWLLNLAIIGAVLFVVPRLGPALDDRIHAVAWAVVVAGLLQLGVQGPTLYRLGFRPRPAWGWRRPRLRRVLALMGPAALGRAVTQVNVMIDSLLALWIGGWAPAALYFSDRLVQLPLGLFATALATVLLPVLSGQAAGGRREDLLHTVAHALRMLWFVMVPAAFGLMALGDALVAAAFERGMFSGESTVLAARAVLFYAPVLIVYPLAKILAPAFHALQDTRTPLRVGLVAVSLNIVLSVVFMLTWPEGFKHAGIALATVVAAAVNGAGLLLLFRRRVGWPGGSALGRSVARMLAGGVGLALSARSAYGGILRLVGPESGLGGTLLALAGAGLLGLGIYVGVVLALGGREPGELLATLRRPSRHHA